MREGEVKKEKRPGAFFYLCYQGKGITLGERVFLDGGGGGNLDPMKSTQKVVRNISGEGEKRRNLPLL